MSNSQSSAATAVSELSARERTATVLDRARSNWRRWAAIASLLAHAGTGVVALGLLLNVVLGLLPVAFVLGTSVMIARVIEPSQMSLFTRIRTPFAVAFGALVLQNVLSALQGMLGEFVTHRLNGQCRRRLMVAGMDSAPMALLEQQDVLDKLSDARTGMVESLATPGGAAAGLLALVARYTQLLSSVVLISFVLRPSAGIVIGATGLLARVANRGSLSLWSAVYNGLAASRRKLRYLLDTGSDTAVGKDLRVLGIVSWWRARAEQESLAYLRQLWRERRRIYLTPFLGFTGLQVLGAIAVFGLLRHSALGGSLSSLQLAIAIQAILIPVRFGVFFPESDVQTQYGMLAYDALREIEGRFSTEGRVSVGSRAVDGLPAKGIRFEHVEFSYPGQKRLILDDLNLELEAGRSTAIVGLNGAGKTTLVKLLARLYEPTSGRIYVDDAELQSFDSRFWQKRLAIIFQDYVRYELDARTNVTLGAPERMSDESAFQSALEWAGATEVLAKLPRGPATPLSSRYAGGVDLSGGQWQRLAMARAFFAVRAGASVLVLDEPTAQLDVRAEVAFFDRFLELTQGLTTVLISHRFSSVRRADRIVVIEGGRVLEQGSHDELMRTAGRYAELFELQARRFSEQETPAVES